MNLSLMGGMIFIFNTALKIKNSKIRCGLNRVIYKKANLPYLLNINMKILITGATGFLGINTTVLFLEKGYEVIGISRRGEKNLAEPLKRDGKNLKIIKGDITSQNFWKTFAKKKEKIDAILHLAGLAQAIKTTDTPRQLFEANTLGTFNVLEFSRLNGKIPVIFASTGQIYPLTDMTARSFYGASKYAADLFCQEYMLTYKIPVIINRLGVIYGPYFKPLKSPKDYTSWVNWFLFANIAGLPIFLANDGKLTRDPVFAKDIAELFEIQVRNKRMINKIYDVGGGTDSAVSMKEMVFKIENASGKKFKQIDYLKEKPKTRVRYMADIKKLKPYWKPRVSLDEGLKITTLWLNKKYD